MEASANPQLKKILGGDHNVVLVSIHDAGKDYVVPVSPALYYELGDDAACEMVQSVVRKGTA